MDKNAKLILVATMGFLALLGGLLFFPVPKDNIQIFIFIAGLVGGFYFGSAIKQPVPPGTVTSTTTDNTQLTTKGANNNAKVNSSPPSSLDPTGL